MNVNLGALTAMPFRACNMFYCNGVNTSMHEQLPAAMESALDRLAVQCLLD